MLPDSKFFSAPWHGGHSLISWSLIKREKTTPYISRENFCINKVGLWSVIFGDLMFDKSRYFLTWQIFCSTILPMYLFMKCNNFILRHNYLIDHSYFVSPSQELRINLITYILSRCFYILFRCFFCFSYDILLYGTPSYMNSISHRSRMIHKCDPTWIHEAEYSGYSEIFWTMRHGSFSTQKLYDD